ETVDLSLQLPDALIQTVDLSQQFSQDYSLVSLHPAAQRLLQSIDLAAQAAPCQLSQENWVFLSLPNMLQHRSSGLTHYVRSHRSELDVSSFQQLLDAVDNVNPLPHKVRPMSHQFAQIALLGRRYEAG